MRIKIGSANETISGYDATYVITYDVRGALRHFADHSELYWDATGSPGTPSSSRSTSA